MKFLWWATIVIIEYEVMVEKLVCTTLCMIFSVIWYFMLLWWLFGCHFLWTNERLLSWMMDEFICWPKPYVLLSATCDEILSWLIEIWMKIHLVSDSNYRIVNLYSPNLFFFEDWQTMLGQHLVLVTVYRSLRLVLSKTIRIGDINNSYLV